MTDESDKSLDKEQSEQVASDQSLEAGDLPQAVAITETGSSVIIDMVQLGGQGPPETPVPPSPMMSNPNLDRITFSDLEALVPKREPTPVIETPKPPAAAPAPTPAPSDEFVEVKPPSFTKFIFTVLLLILVGLLAFVGMRLEWDWALIQKDPELAAQIVAGLREKPQPVAPQTVASPPPEQMRGRLLTADLVLTRTKLGKQSGIRVDGVVKNGTNRLQRAMTLQVFLTTPEGLKTDSQRIQCCTSILATHDDTASKGADPKRGESPPDTVLRPGQSAQFSAFFPKPANDDTDLKVTADVVFSEAERVAE
ncbi:MAG: hypothetical protein VX589_00140 [Myxococcota bacterium]|nr:hypothetical protein [Myxococcota bacterium]